MDLMRKGLLYFFSKEFVFFVLIGIVNTLNGTVFSLLLSAVFSVNVAFIIGYAFSLCIAYILNSFFIFKKPLNGTALLKFMLSYIPNFLIQNIMVFVIYNLLGFHKIIAFLCAAVFGIPITFLLVKLFVFRKSKQLSYCKTGICKTYCFVRRNPWLFYILTFLLYLFLACLANWSLISGDNLMKYDIFDAHFPNSVFLEDSLSAGIIPLWNPLMQYGSPHYAIVGTPIFYPTTIISALVGYRTMLMGAEYIFHVALGCFGMFLLAKDYQTNGKHANFHVLLTSFSVGILYGFSTVFLSNTQHIMIIISAAWIPITVCFINYFLRASKLIFLLTAGICSGFIFLGGYPEQLIMLFLILIPYFVFYCYNRNKSFYKNILTAAGKYILFFLCTILFSAILIVPFVVSSGKAARLISEFGQDAGRYPLVLFFTSLVPGLEAISDFTFDRAWQSFYFGIGAFLSIPAILLIKHTHKILFFILSIFSFLMLLGKDSFLHSLFFKYFPLFDTLRFPSVWRNMIVLILLISSALVWKNFFKDKDIQDAFLRAAYILLGIMVVLSVAAWSTSYLINELEHSEQLINLSSKIMLSAGLIFLYIILVKYLKNNILSKKVFAVLFAVLILVEAFTFQFMQTPYTIAQFAPTDTLSSAAAKSELEYYKNFYHKRNKSVDFSAASRTNSNLLQSKWIMLKKTFDESGYISYRLAKTEEYKSTYNSNIMAENPIAFFTNNVVSSSEKSFDKWVWDAGVAPAQIHVESSPVGDISSLIQKFGDVKEEVIAEFLPRTEDGNVCIAGEMLPDLNTTFLRTLRIYLFNPVADFQNINAVFSYNNSSSYRVEGSFSVYSNNRGSYFDLYFPSHTQEYNKVVLEMDNETVIKKAELIHCERNRADKHVKIKKLVPNSVVVDVEAPTDGYLTLLQNTYPGWNLYVDGKKQDITEINQTFLGAFLTEGFHRVEFHFLPVDFFVGVGITAVYLLFWLFLLIRYVIILKKHNYRSKNENSF